MAKQSIPNSTLLVWGLLVYLIIVTILLWLWLGKHNDEGE